MIEWITAHPYITIWTILIVFFERAMYCGYVVDDDSRYVRMKTLKNAWKEKPNKTLSFYTRFIWESIYGAGVFPNGRWEHGFTLLVHGINCSLIYSITGSLLASVLYLLNPINNQTTLWLNGRRYAMSILAVLLAWKFWILAPLMIAFCAWLHVSGIMMPVLFLATPLWQLALAGMGIGYLLGFKRNKGVFNSRKKDFKKGNLNQEISPRKLILVVKTIGHHFWNCLLPLKPMMYHEFLFYFSATDEGTKNGFAINFDFLKGIAAIGILSYLMIWQHSFWAMWFCVFIIQWCNIYQVTMNASDRYCSLPNIGMMCLLAEYIMKLPQPYNVAVASFLIALYMFKYYPLFRAYRNVESFHLYHINLQPDGVQSRFFLSKIYLARKDPYSAMGLIRKGLAYKPTDFKLLLGFIDCLLHLGQITNVLKAMDFTEKHVPELEREDTKNLFNGIRKQYHKQYESLRSNYKGKNYIHNGGQPIVKIKKT